MYGLTTLAKLNRDADEAHRIVAAHAVGKPQPAVSPSRTQREAPAAVINRLLDGAKG